jgi:drug/metabolite transporter (DMT)-like permease
MPQTAGMAAMNRQDFLLLIVLTICWGVNWPLIKLAVTSFPPLAFRSWSMLLGLVFLAPFLVMRAERFWPQRTEWRSIVLLSIPNMALFHWLMIISLPHISSGRAAILAYTMPAWAAISGMLIFGHRPKPFQLVAVGLALIATLLLSISEFSSLTGSPMSVLMMLVAAASWGYGTVLMKQTRLSISNASLLFWMLTISGVLIALSSLVSELPSYRLPTVFEWIAIIYNALVVFAICHILWFRLARKLPPVVSSLAIMLIPPIGVFTGSLTINESIGIYDIVALLLILISMAVVLSPGLKKNSST